MTIYIRDPATDALVRKLARKEKVGLGAAVKIAVTERLKALEAQPSLHERLSRIVEEIARAPKTGKRVGKKFFDNLSGS